MKQGRLKNRSILDFGTVACIVLLIIAIAFYLDHIIPFGDNLLVYHDMKYQYVDFFMWFRRVLSGADSLEYSFVFGLGGNTIAMFAYYLASPLNILMIFCPAASIGVGLTFLIVLKLLLCGMTACMYIHKRFNVRGIYAVLLSVSYALMGYNLLQCSNIMWLDGVIVLPLIAYGIFRLVHDSKLTIYYAALFYGVFANWYIGYMLCLFAVIYFVLEVLLCYAERFQNNRKDLLRSFFRFVITSLFSVATTAMLFLPQTLFMMGEGEAFDWNIFTPNFNFSYLEGFRDLVLEPDKLTQSQWIPPIYIGTLCVILLIAVIFSDKVSTFYKTVTGFFLFGFMFIFMYRPLDYAFTVFKAPSSHFYRYAFMFSFLCIAFAAFAVMKGVTQDKKALRRAALTWFVIIWAFDMIRPYTKTTSVAVSAIIALIAGCILCCKSRGKLLNRRLHVLLSGILAVCVIVEFSSKAQLEFADHTDSAEYYQSFNTGMLAAVNDLQASDPEYYRVDSNICRWGPDEFDQGLALGYSSIGQYSSANNTGVTHFLMQMGYGMDQTLMDYTSLLPIDSLLGEKYVFSVNPVYGYNLEKENVYEETDLYSNPYALTIAYPVTEVVSSLEFGASAFDNHNMVYSAIAGEPLDIYTSNAIIDFQKPGATQFTWTVQVQADGLLYVDSLYGIGNIQIYLNETYLRGNSWHYSKTRCLGEFKAGDTLTFTVNASNGVEYAAESMDFRTLNEETMSQVLSPLQENMVQHSVVNNKRVTFTYTANEAGYLMLTIPYENGWKLTVNGKKYDIAEEMNVFMAVPVEAGTNEITLEFHLPGKWAGIVITIVSLVLFIFWSRLVKRKEQGFTSVEKTPTSISGE